MMCTASKGTHAIPLLTVLRRRLDRVMLQRLQRKCVQNTRIHETVSKATDAEHTVRVPKSHWKARLECTNTCGMYIVSKSNMTHALLGQVMKLRALLCPNTWPRHAATSAMYEYMRVYTISTRTHALSEWRVIRWDHPVPSVLANHDGCQKE